jgi:hypothetical protein
VYRKVFDLCFFYGLTGHSVCIRTNMSRFARERAARQRTLLRRLVCRVLEVDESAEEYDEATDSENVEIAVKFCLDNLKYHSFQSPNIKAIRNDVDA